MFFKWRTSWSTQKGYLSEPTEMMAHAFEVRFPRGLISVDQFAGETSPRHPMRAEANAQTTHWKKFHKQIKPLVAHIPTYPHRQDAPAHAWGSDHARTATQLKIPQPETALPLAARFR